MARSAEECDVLSLSFLFGTLDTLDCLAVDDEDSFPEESSNRDVCLFKSLTGVVDWLTIFRLADGGCVFVEADAAEDGVNDGDADREDDVEAFLFLLDETRLELIG